MRNRARFFIGTAGVLLVVAVAVFLFLRYELRKSYPEQTGSVTVPGLTGPVEVFRDAFGVPRIQAANEKDLFLAMGYVYAQDRLWQMDMERRVAEGRLSEVVGIEALPFDRMFRIVGLRSIAESIERSLTPESRDRLAWYADGVNRYLESHAGKLPIEFDMLRYDPEPWKPLHSIEAARLMAWELNLSWWSDLTMGSIAERVGLEKALEIFPGYPVDVPPAVPEKAWRAYALLSSGMREVAREYAAFFGLPVQQAGSNAWAVAPSHSATGGVLLANDTHLHLQLPSTWYEVELRAPGLHVRGMSVPGVPGVVAGRNDSIAWGVTNAMADDADFYVERLDSVDASRYAYDGTWLPLTVREEAIGVRGDTTYPVVIRSTRHGPIVTDIRTPLNHAAPTTVASMRWTGAEVDDQIDACSSIDRAHTWKEFTAGLKKFAIPAQNFVYGDVRGNIGYWCAARLPLRGKQSTLLPLPGWERSAEWKGFVPFEELPHLFNPPEGYIASANNKVVDDSYPFHVSDLWEPPSRIIRLREVLGTPGAMFMPEDFVRLQNDEYSHFARQVLPFILQAYQDSITLDPEEQAAFEYFRNWNFVFAQSDIATSIFQEFTVHLFRNIYVDEMGEDLYHDFVILLNVPTRVTLRLLQEGSSPWFDDVRTEDLETRDMIVRRSLRDALHALRERLGDDMKRWRWGDLHTVTLTHPFGLRTPWGRVFNIGPFSYGGGSTALVSGEYSMNDPFAVVIGASYRQVFDLGLTGASCVILPGGQSGQVFHEHYGDQTQLWLRGGTREYRWNETAGFPHRLVLEPAR